MATICVSTRAGVARHEDRNVPAIAVRRSQEGRLVRDQHEGRLDARLRVRVGERQPSLFEDVQGNRRRDDQRTARPDPTNPTSRIRSWKSGFYEFFSFV